MIDAVLVAKSLVGGDIGFMPKMQVMFNIPGLNISNNQTSDEIRLKIGNSNTFFTIRSISNVSSYEFYFYERSGVSLPSEYMVMLFDTSDLEPFIAKSVSGWYTFDTGNFPFTAKNKDVVDSPYLYMKIKNKSESNLTSFNLFLSIGGI